MYETVGRAVFFRNEDGDSYMVCACEFDNVNISYEQALENAVKIAAMFNDRKWTAEEILKREG